MNRYLVGQELDNALYAHLRLENINEPSPDRRPRFDLWPRHLRRCCSSPRPSNRTRKPEPARHTHGLHANADMPSEISRLPLDRIAVKMVPLMINYRGHHAV